MILGKVSFCTWDVDSSEASAGRRWSSRCATGEGEGLGLDDVVLDEGNGND